MISKTTRVNLIRVYCIYLENTLAMETARALYLRYILCMPVSRIMVAKGIKGSIAVTISKISLMIIHRRLPSHSLTYLSNAGDWYRRLLLCMPTSFGWHVT